MSEYARRLEKKRGNLGDESTMEGMSLNAGILLSLESCSIILKEKAKTVDCITDLT